jgi:hypothetical protein
LKTPLAFCISPLDWSENERRDGVVREFAADMVDTQAVAVVPEAV